MDLGCSYMENGFLNPRRAKVGSFHCSNTARRKFLKAALVALSHRHPWVTLGATHWPGCLKDTVSLVTYWKVHFR